MGILEDLGIDLNPENPMYQRLAGGERPRPSMLQDLGIDLTPPTGVSPIRGGGLLQSMGISMNPELQQQMQQGMIPPEPELTWGRAGGALVEGAKDVGRNYADFLGAVSDSLNNLKENIPGYEGSESFRNFVDTAMQFHPVVGPLTRPEAAEAFYRLAKSEYLAADPDYMQSSGWIEDVLRAGPQMATMVLANLAGGPPAGMAAMGMMIAGGTYRNLVDQGVDKDRALAAGLINGIVQAPMEQIPFSKMGRLFQPRKQIVQRIKDLVTVAGAEWATEFVQAFPDEFINIFALNPDKSMLDRTEMFMDKLGEIAKQGAYEGTLTAPWAILTGGGAMAVGEYRKRQHQQEAAALLERLRAEKEGRPKIRKPLGAMGPPPVDLTGVEPITEREFARRGATYLESLEAGIPVEGITEEEFMASAIENLYNLEFDVEFERRRAESRQRYQEREDLVAKAMAAAEQKAKEVEFDIEFKKRKEGYREFLAEQAEAQREAGIYKLDAVAAYDVQREAYKEFLKQREQARKVEAERARQQRETAEYKKALAQRRKDLDAALAFIKTEDLAGPEARPISREQYQKLREALGPQVSEVYEIDQAIPAEHRVSFFSMWRDAAKRTKPDWYKKPFKAGDVDSYKFTDHDLNRLMQKLYLNQTLSPMQQDMFDHLLEVSTQLQRQQKIDKMIDRQALEVLSDTGYEIVAGKAMPWGAVGAGNRIVMEMPDGTWDEFMMVGMKGRRAQFANEKSVFDVPADEVTDKIIGYRIDEEWLRQRRAEVAAPAPIVERGGRPEKFTPEQREYQQARGAIEPLMDEQMTQPELQKMWDEDISKRSPVWQQAFLDYAAANEIEIKVEEAVPEEAPAERAGLVAMAEAMEEAEQPVPITERRAVEEAERMPWDVPFRNQWLTAMDLTEDDFVEYGKRQIAEGNRDFKQFAQRMGKKIEKDTPLDSAMKIIWARVQARIPPTKKVSEMTSDEKSEYINTDFLTKLRSRHAFEYEDDLKRIVVALDLDALKWVNDNLGHQTGDVVLIAFGDAMRATGLDPGGLYHISGDEFWISHDDPAGVAEGLQKLQNFLDNHPVMVNYKGVDIPYTIGVSYGIGETTTQAESELKAAKRQRERTGERPKRGAAPSQFLRELAKRGIDYVPTDTEPEKAVPERIQREALTVPTLPKEPTHEQVQRAIDSVEDQLEAAGVPVEQWSEYPELEKLYHRRYQIESDQMVEGLSLIPGDQKISVNLLHADSGEKIPEQIGADTALREVDQQLEKYYMLLECLDASS